MTSTVHISSGLTQLIGYTEWLWHRETQRSENTGGTIICILVSLYSATMTTQIL